jgi:hypothetical protein
MFRFMIILAHCFTYIGQAPFLLRNDKFFYDLKNISLVNQWFQWHLQNFLYIKI